MFHQMIYTRAQSTKLFLAPKIKSMQINPYNQAGSASLIASLNQIFGSPFRSYVIVKPHVNSEVAPRTNNKLSNGIDEARKADKMPAKSEMFTSSADKKKSDDRISRIANDLAAMKILETSKITSEQKKRKYAKKARQKLNKEKNTKQRIEEEREVREELYKKVIQMNLEKKQALSEANLETKVTFVTSDAIKKLYGSLEAQKKK